MKKQSLPYLRLILVSTLVYLHTLAFTFVGVDDAPLIVTDIHKIGIFNYFNTFSSIFQPFYRPVLLLSYIGNALFAYQNPFYFHLVNILIHALNGCLVFILLRNFKSSEKRAFIISIFFALHPAAVPAVVWIPGRNDSLLALFSLLSFIALISYSKRSQLVQLVLHLVTFTLAIFTKETAIMLIPLFIIYAKFFPKLPRQKIILLLISWVNIFLVWLLLRSQFMVAFPNLEVAMQSFFQSFTVYFSEAITYLGKIILPFNLTPMPIAGQTKPFSGMIALMLMVILYIKVSKKNTGLALFGLAWSFLFLIPAVLPSTVSLLEIFFEHRLYLSLIGVAVFLSTIRLPRKVETVIASVVIVTFLIAGIRYSLVYSSPATYWSEVKMKSPEIYIRFQDVIQEWESYSVTNKIPTGLGELSQPYAYTP